MRTRLRQLFLFVVDFLLGAVSVVGSLMLRFGDTDTSELTVLVQRFTGATFFALIMPPIVFYFAELYSSAADCRRPRWMSRLLGAIAFSVFLLIGVYYWLPMWRMYRGALLYHVASFAPLMILWRYLYSSIHARRRGARRTLIVGTTAAANLLAALLEKHPDSRWRVCGFIRDKNGTPKPDLMHPIMGDIDALQQVTEEHRIQSIIYVRSALSKASVRNLLTLKMCGIEVRDGLGICKELTQRLPVWDLDEFWLLGQDGFDLVRNRMTQRIQRAMDIAFSALTLVVTAPLLGLAALAVLITMGRPILFKQERVGINEKVFWLYKLRTMRRDAEKGSGPVWSKGRHDPRVTATGRFLRRTRIDELPQLWNVLAGHMSFIGPRPERPHFVQQLKKEIPYYSLRFLVKPGLSGWAQVNYRYGASNEDAIEKLQYELYYIQEMSVVLNLLILIRTVPAVLFHEGS